MLKHLLLQKAALPSPRLHTTLLPIQAPEGVTGGSNRSGSLPGHRTQRGKTGAATRLARRQGPQAPAPPNAGKPRSPRGWRYPRARTVPQRPRPWSHLGSSNSRGWAAELRQLLTKVRSAPPRLTPDPQARTHRSFRETRPRKGRRERRKEGAPAPPGGSDVPRGRRAPGSRCRLRSNAREPTSTCAVSPLAWARGLLTF